MASSSSSSSSSPASPSFSASSSSSSSSTSAVENAVVFVAAIPEQGRGKSGTKRNAKLDVFVQQKSQIGPVTRKLSVPLLITDAAAQRKGSVRKMKDQYRTPLAGIKTKGKNTLRYEFPPRTPERPDAVLLAMCPLERCNPLDVCNVEFLASRWEDMVHGELYLQGAEEDALVVCAHAKVGPCAVLCEEKVYALHLRCPHGCCSIVAVSLEYCTGTFPKSPFATVLVSSPEAVVTAHAGLHLTVYASVHLRAWCDAARSGFPCVEKLAIRRIHGGDGGDDSGTDDEGDGPAPGQNHGEENDSGTDDDNDGGDDTDAEESNEAPSSVADRVDPSSGSQPPLPAVQPGEAMSGPSLGEPFSPLLKRESSDKEAQDQRALKRHRTENDAPVDTAAAVAATAAAAAAAAAALSSPSSSSSSSTRTDCDSDNDTNMSSN